MAAEGQVKSRRADAERNRRRLLDAAAKAFAKHGLDVSISYIAAMARVGQGTVFRHFPTKEHLVSAILCDRIDGVAAIGTRLLEMDDAGAALREFMRAGTSAQVEDVGFFEALDKTTMFSDGEVRAAIDRALDVADRLLKRAQQQGTIRADITNFDLMTLQHAICVAGAGMQAVRPDLWQRYLDIVLDALSPEGSHPLSRPAPTPAQFERVLRHELRPSASRR